MLGEHLSLGGALVAVGLPQGRVAGGVGDLCTSPEYAQGVAVFAAGAASCWRGGAFSCGRLVTEIVAVAV